MVEGRLFTGVVLGGAAGPGHSWYVPSSRGSCLRGLRGFRVEGVGFTEGLEFRLLRASEGFRGSFDMAEFGLIGLL